MKQIIPTKVTPLYTTLIVTRECFEDNLVVNGIIRYHKGEIKPYQKVIAAGHHCSIVKAGDTVQVNYSNYVRQGYRPNSIAGDMNGQEKVAYLDIPSVTLNGEIFSKLDERDIDFVLNEFEEQEVEASTEVIVND